MKKYRFHIVIVFVGYAMLVASTLGLLAGLAWSGLSIRGLVFQDNLFPKLAKDSPGRMNSRLKLIKKLKIDVPETVLQNCAKSGELSAEDEAKLEKEQVNAVHSLLVKEEENHKKSAQTMKSMMTAVCIFHTIFGVVLFVMSVGGIVLGKFLIQKIVSSPKESLSLSNG